MTKIILKSSLAAGVAVGVFFFAVHFLNLKTAKESHAPSQPAPPIQAVVPPVVDFDEKTMTLLSGNPVLSLHVGTGARSGRVNVGTTVSETYRMNSWQFFNYTIGDTDDFVFSRVSWGYFDGSNAFHGKAGNIGSRLVMGLHGAAGKQLKVAVWDTSHHKKDFLVDLAGDWKNRTLDLSGLDTANIAMVDFVADQTNTGPNGSVGIVMRGLAYIWTASGVVYDPSALSVLPESPAVSSGHGTIGSSDSATITTTQARPTTISAVSGVSDPGDYTYSRIGWGYFSDSKTFVGAGVTLGHSVTLVLSGTAGHVLKVEFVSSANAEMKKVFNVTLTAKPKNYTFDITGFEPLGLIDFVQDQPGTTKYTVEVKGLAYTPVVAGAAYNRSALSTLAGSPVVRSSFGTTTSSDNATITVTQLNATTYHAVSDVPDKGDITYSSISWGYFNDPTRFVGTGAKLGKSVTLVLSGTVGRVLKVEFVSSADAGIRKVFDVTLWAGQRNYTFDIEGFGPVGLMNFVQGQPGTTDYTVETKGLAYTPMVSGVAYDPSALSTLAGSPVLRSGFGTITSSDNATITTTQVSATTYKAVSDVPDRGDFTYSRIRWGYFSNPTTFVGAGAKLGKRVTLALSGTAGRVLRVEFVSSANSGIKKVFHVMLSPGQKNYAFDIAGFGPVGFIDFVQDETGMTRYAVEVEGLNYVDALITVSTNCLEGDDRFSPKYLFQEKRTIWHAESPPRYPQWVEMEFPEPSLVTHLGLRSQSDSLQGAEHARGPKDFILQGSNQPAAAFLGLAKNRKWVDLLEVKDNAFAKGEEWKDWFFENITPYLYYRIYIKAGGDPQYLTIRQIRMDDATQLPKPADEAPVAIVRPAVVAPVEVAKTFDVAPVVTPRPVPRVSLDPPKFNPANLRDRYNKVLQRAGVKTKEDAMDFSLAFWEKKRKAYAS